MSTGTINWDDLTRLISLFEDYNLTELTVEEDGLRLVMKADDQVVAAETFHPVYETDAALFPPLTHPDTEPVSQEASNLAPLTSPMVGIFYRAPSPDAPAFIEVGEDIEVGQTIGLIEAMKVFSEIPSEVAGRVVSIPAQNGQLVQQGEILIMVDVGGVHG